jgi:hypothetical protein
MTVVTLPNITGSGNHTPMQLSATSVKARWVQVSVNSAATIGDSSINSTGNGQGIPLAANTTYLFPECCDGYDLSQLYLILFSGVCWVMYGS